LKFSEVYFTNPGEKQFDVKIGSRFVAKNLDIFGTLLSKMLPLDIFVNVEKKGGKLYIDGEEVTNGLKKNQIVIDFSVGRADNPKVNAILLV